MIIYMRMECILISSVVPKLKNAVMLIFQRFSHVYELTIEINLGKHAEASFK